MAENEDQPEAAPAGNSGMMGKLLIAGFLVGVISAEAAVAYLLIPSAADIAKAAETYKEELEKKKMEESEGASAVEVELGMFGVSVRQPQNASTLRVDLKLFGTVSEDKKSEFDTLYERNKNRFRSLILEEIRAADVEAWNDAQLGLIKRRILEKSHKVFGQSLLGSVGFAELSVILQ